MPTHQREAVEAIRYLESARQLPIGFIDGQEDAFSAIDGMVPDAIYVTFRDLDNLQNPFSSL